MDLLRNLKKIILTLVLFMVTFDIGVIVYQTLRMHLIDQQASLRERVIIKPVKFFQIGFSKCGTRSLADFFNSNAVPIVHHDAGHLAINIYENYQKGLPLIPDIYSGFYGFFDMERMYDYPPISIPMLLFKELDRQYPGSKFILNTRDKQAWLRSKATHPAYHQKMRWLDLHAKFYNITKDEVLAMWSKEWDDQHQAVLEYFKDRPNDLLVFDIEKDPPQKLCDFFKEYFVLNPKFYGHKNKSVDREREKVVNY